MARHIPNEHGECPHWCAGCRSERIVREATQGKPGPMTPRERSQAWLDGCKDDVRLEWKDMDRMDAMLEAHAKEAVREALKGAAAYSETRSKSDHTPEFLRRKGGSCDACAEAGLLASAIRAMVPK